MPLKRLASPASVLLLLVACPFAGCRTPITTPTQGTCVYDDHPAAATSYTATVRVVDEGGSPLSDVTVDVGDAQAKTGADGTATLPSLQHSVAAIVSKDGYLAEPVAFGWAAATTPVQVKLWSAKGRLAVHSAGDVMFGRRYEAPKSSTQPLIDPASPGKGAKAVVEGVRRAFSAADVRTLNFETVVSDRPDTAAYPGKKYVLKSPPGTVDGLAALAPSAAGNANNHTRDFGDDGVADTLKALEGANIPHIGVSSTGDEPPPVTITANGVKVGLLAWTNLDGSYINDVYAKDGDPAPATPDPKNAFQYDPRSWGVTTTTFDVPTASRRIGSAWGVFKTGEANANAPDDATAWASLSNVYPEMQDWVVRRGHGGAAFWHKSGAAPQIAALKKSSDVVIVNLHAGLQFIDAPPTVVKTAARDAIDAGADMVVCHHPHVLQGFEFYKGHLIAYSLGNLVFDQDFFSTFASVMLRTIWEGNRLLEARVVPLEVKDYVPVHLTDDAARRRALRLWELSALGATTKSDIDSGSHVRIFVDTPSTDSAPASVVVESGTARIVPDAPKEETVNLTVPAGGIADIGFDGLVHARVGAGADDAKLFVGRDLFQWGRFEDEAVGPSSRGDMHWDVKAGDCNADTTMGTDAFQGRGYLRIVRHSTSSSEISVRPTARVPLPSHRLYDAPTGMKPLDGTPTYSIRFAGRYSGTDSVIVHVDGYSFEDTSLIEDPVSTITKGVDLPVDLPKDGQWHVVDMPIPADVLGGENNPSNMMFVYFRMKPDAGKSSSFDVDNLQVIEWRSAATMPDGFGLYELVRNDDAAPKTLAIRAWPSTR